MKKISRWAKNHKKLSRIIIVASFTVLTALGIATGLLLTDAGVSISSYALFIISAVYVAGLVAYPSRSLRQKKLNAAVFYIRQKSCDLMLATSTFCMIIYFSNRPGEIFSYSAALNAAIPISTSIPKDSAVKAYKSIADFKASLKDENGKALKWKAKKKLLKEQIRGIKKDKDMSAGAKVGLIILSVAVALGLLYLVAALSCNLSCSGSEGAAIFVLGAGGGLVIFLLVLAIRAILGKKRKRKNKEPDQDNPVKVD